MAKLFEGKVVVVTGAGSGIGRSHAIHFAKEGAKVVVNDLGTSVDGSGKSTNVADHVVEEIKAFGGTAVANYDSVADMKGAENIIKTAIDNFGRIDVLVNNAGILRDKTLMKMTEQEWDLVILVHLKGTFACTKAALPYMREQGYGRIINTTSFAGLMGNFGQTNYSAAKAGIYGFTRTLALEVEKYGIMVNAIAPLAKTRMTKDIGAVPAEFKPEQVSPMVMFLGSDKCKVTGKVFGIHGNQLFEYRMMTNEGVEKDSPWTVEEIEQRLEEIMKFETPSKGGLDVSNILPKLNEVLKEVGLQVVSSTAVPAGAGAPAGELSLSDMFQKMKEVFIPEKAGDWKGLIQFEIAGDQPQAVYIENGKVTIKSEKGSNPACTITTDKDTMIAIIKGEMDANKAFMKGKIKADKLPVLMKFSQMFNLNKLPQLLTQQKTAAVPTGKKTEDKATPAIGSLQDYMMKFKEVFKADKAGDAKLTIYFKIDGDSDYAFYIANNSVDIKVEKPQSPDLTITTDKETMYAMLTGKLHPNKAFMKRKLKADKMPLLMKFNQYFDMDKLSEIIKKETSAQKQEAAPGTGLNRSYIGKKYYGVAQHVKPEDTKRYAKATNEKNPIYYTDDLNKLAIPPLFPVSLMKPLVEKILLDDGLNMDLLRMVHAEHEIKYYRPLKPWDLVYTTAQITDMTTVSSGEIMTVKIFGKVSGRDVFEMVAKFFVRGKSKPKDKSKPKEEEKPSGKKLFDFKIKVDPDQSKRYAEASGDDNPIHLDPETAKAAGLPDIILHGLCTMAFCSQAVVENVAKSDPRKLERIKVRFSKPVFMNDELTITGWLEKEENGKIFLKFEAVNQKGEKVITHGEASILK